MYNNFLYNKKDYSCSTVLPLLLFKDQLTIIIQECNKKTSKRTIRGINSYWFNTNVNEIMIYLAKLIKTMNGKPQIFKIRNDRGLLQIIKI